MDGKIKGPVLTGLNSKVMSGSFSSGWASLYAGNNNTDIDLESVEVENVNFGIDSPDEIPNDNTNNNEYNYWKELAIKHLSKNISKDISKLIGKKIGKELTKNFLFRGSIYGEIISTLGLGYFFTIASCGITNLVRGKEYDWKKEAAKTSAKQIGRFGVETFCLFATYIISGKNLDLTKNDLSSFIGKAVEKEWEDKIKNSSNYIALKNSSNKKIIKRTLGEIRADRYLDRQMVQNKLGIIKVEDRFSFKYSSFIKNYGVQMLSGVGIDTLFGVCGNVISSMAVDGNSFKDALKDASIGEEFLKSSVKMVCSTAGTIIGATLGNATLGKNLGTVIGGAVGEIAVEPFKDEEGNIEQGWCVAAGAAVLGGAVAGPALITGVVTCAVAAPVGLVVAGAILVGALAGYLIVYGAHELSKIAKQSNAELNEANINGGHSGSSGSF